MFISRKVLIADPDESALVYMKAVIRSKGYDVVDVIDGGLAWDEMNCPDPPVLAIVALQMNSMSGLEFCRRSKRDENLKSIPILVVCDTSMSAGRNEAFWMKGLGCDDFMFKPFDPLALLGRVEVMMRSVADAEAQRAAAPAFPRSIVPDYKPQPKEPMPIVDTDSAASVTEPKQPAAPEPVSLKDAKPEALLEMYLNAAPKGQFGLEYDIQDSEMTSGIDRAQYERRRQDAYEAAGKPSSEIISLEGKESHNVAKVTCRRRETVNGLQGHERTEEYCFKKTFQGWKLISVRVKPAAFKIVSDDESTDGDNPR
ncbi:MAG: response regulator [Candidatus Sumerlaeales bacterium]|nr:response regulator [Candidatus Sumerlaeales bacterium]